MTTSIFYSYSHKDELFKETLETHLAILKRQGFIDGWNDRRIAPGGNWKEEIDLRLQNAAVVLLLVSSNFLASDYCYDTETIFALEQHKKGHCIVIPIIVKPCLWTVSHFTHLQALPKDGKPITTWSNQDEAWLDVSLGVLKIIKDNHGYDQRELRSIEEAGKNSKPLGSDVDDRPILEAVTGEIHPESSIPKPLDSDGGIKPGDNIPQTEVLDEGVKPGGNLPTTLSKKIILFLRAYDSWYFSPLRIQKWGGKQEGFKSLSKFDTYSIKVELENLLKDGKLKIATSKKGNRIYKLI